MLNRAAGGVLCRGALMLSAQNIDLHPFSGPADTVKSSLFARRPLPSPRITPLVARPPRPRHARAHHFARCTAPAPTRPFRWASGPARPTATALVRPQLSPESRRSRLRVELLIINPNEEEHRP